MRDLSLLALSLVAKMSWTPACRDWMHLFRICQDGEGQVEKECRVWWVFLSPRVLADVGALGEPLSSPAMYFSRRVTFWFQEKRGPGRAQGSWGRDGGCRLLRHLLKGSAGEDSGLRHLLLYSSLLPCDVRDDYCLIIMCLRSVGPMPLTRPARPPQPESSYLLLTEKSTFGLLVFAAMESQTLKPIMRA